MESQKGKCGNYQDEMQLRSAGKPSSLQIPLLSSSDTAKTAAPHAPRGLAFGALLQSTQMGHISVRMTGRQCQGEILPLQGTHQRALFGSYGICDRIPGVVGFHTETTGSFVQLQATDPAAWRLSAPLHRWEDEHSGFSRKP